MQTAAFSISGWSEVTSKLTGGELGGVLDAGAKLINKARREVGLLAVGITETFNRQHSDLNGDKVRR